MNVNVFLLMYSPFFVFCFLNTKEDVFFYANSLIANCGDFLYKMFMNFANGKITIFRCRLFCFFKDVYWWHALLMIYHCKCKSLWTDLVFGQLSLATNQEKIWKSISQHMLSFGHIKNAKVLSDCGIFEIPRGHELIWIWII